MFCFNDFDPKMFRFLRILICLLLILCILVNCSPLRARATSVALPVVGASVAVSAPVVIGAVVIACGLYLASDAGSAAFNNLVSSISDGLDSAYTYVSEAGEKFIKCLSIDDHYYIPSSLASDVLSSIQSSDLVSVSLSSSDDIDFSAGSSTVAGALSVALPIAQSYGRRFYIVSTTNSPYFDFSIYLNDRPPVDQGTFYNTGVPNQNFITIDVLGNSLYSQGVAGILIKGDHIISIGSFPLSFSTSSPGLSADIGQNLDDEKYKTWVQDPVISINFGVGFEPDPEDPTEPQEPQRIPFFPIKLPSSPDEFPDLTPEEVQGGGSSNIGSGDYIDLDFPIELDPDTVPDELLPGGSAIVTPDVDLPDFDFPTPPAPSVGDDSALGDSPITQFFNWLFQILIEALRWLLEALGALFNWIVNSLLKGIGDLLRALGNFILDGIKAIFVPSQDFLSAKVNALRARFQFMDSVLATGDAIIAALNLSGTPPVIYAHFENAEGAFNWGGTVAVLDMTWYSRYKAAGDAFLSGVIWIFFLWRVFIKLPSIISGVGGTVRTFDSIDSGK